MRHAGSALWLSGLCWCGMFTFFMVAHHAHQVANVLVTMALGPLLTALAARIFIGHRIPLRTWVAIVVAGSGIAYMYASQLGQGVSLAGTLVALCVPIAGAANWTITQHAHAQGKDVDLVPAVLVGAVLSALVTLPLALPFQAIGPRFVAAGLAWGWDNWRFPACWRWFARGCSRRPKCRCWACWKSFSASCWPGWVPVRCRRADVLLGGALVIGALVVNEVIGWRAGRDCVMSDVLCEVVGRLGCITLNRPQALNALSLSMVRALTIALLAWRAMQRSRRSRFVAAARPGPLVLFARVGTSAFFTRRL